jgi:uncharacterized membrane protein YtjA (UPF0391 family)
LNRDLDATFAGDSCFHGGWVRVWIQRETNSPSSGGGNGMLKLALFFFIVSIIAGVFGFTGIAAATAGIAKVLFFIFIIVFVVLLVVGLMVGSAIF